MLACPACSPRRPRASSAFRRHHGSGISSYRSGETSSFLVGWSACLSLRRMLLTPSDVVSLLLSARQSTSIRTHPRRIHQQSRSSNRQEHLHSISAGEQVDRTRYTVAGWIEMSLSEPDTAALASMNAC